MPVVVEIDDSDLKGFSDQAKQRLAVATEEYATNLIEEANRIEAGRNYGRGMPEVTLSMVTDAQELLRRGLTPPRRSMASRVLRVVAAVLPLAVGMMYDVEKLRQPAYMLFFFIVVAVTIITVTISVIKE
jgi:hypothetical protein